jgi:uncharacterized protein (TIGR02996 family)
VTVVDSARNRLACQSDSRGQRIQGDHPPNEPLELLELREVQEAHLTDDPLEFLGSAAAVIERAEAKGTATMMPEEFVRGILAEPDDDTPRLIYADWLEERGDPRGEFIRLQCELATLTKPETPWLRMYGAGHFSPKERIRNRHDVHRYKQLFSRQLALMTAHTKQWVAPLGSEITGLRFERGFVECGSTTADSFLQEAPTWYRHTPLRQLHIKESGRKLASLLQSPLLLHVHSLEFCHRLGDHEASLLAACPNLVNLRNLSLGGYNMGERGYEAILRSDNLRNLKNVQGLSAHEGLSPSLRSAIEARFGYKRGV